MGPAALTLPLLGSNTPFSVAYTAVSAPTPDLSFHVRELGAIPRTRYLQGSHLTGKDEMSLEHLVSKRRCSCPVGAAQ